ncbi:hypothetical protein [Sphingomonas sp. ID0503]|uniref:hypothetical protein n=1 Tax=Sphingomonas sp. ID0503 TaxID=3399691 RepID=UPI003AFA6D80
MKKDTFNVRDRLSAKACLRSADDDALAEGRISAIDLQRANAAFQHIDFSAGRIVLREEDPIL